MPILSIHYENKDVYNPTIPFKYANKIILLGRVESRDTEKDSSVIFFEQKQHNVWKHIEKSPKLSMQDPFVANIHNEWVVGGVIVDWEHKYYQTEFFIGDSPFELHKLAVGPSGMKDIRLVELPSGDIGVFTRPQGGKYKLGKIGFTRIKKLTDIDENLLINAPLIEDQFGDTSWGGVNQAVDLPNGDIGIIGHWAWFVGGNRRYTAMTFQLNPISKKCTQMKIVAERKDFPKTPAKRPDLVDVIFPAGIVENENDKNLVTLYAGLSDTSIGSLEIPSPFSS